ncbi:MAG TPA: S41 family peptidase [Thermoanaerobaculia bacterium]|nr:S41 family peptidase [Thermoanaerobaculia bacterium]
MRISNFGFALALAALGASAAVNPPPSPPQSVLSEIDRYVRGDFWDPKLKGVDWTAAVSRAEGELKAAKSPEERDAVYDRLLAALSDSHTFRLPAGRLPQRGWGTAGLRIGRDGDGWAVKGVLAGSSAERAGMKLGDRIVSVAGKPYGRDPVSFRDLFFVLEGAPGASVDVAWRPLAGGPEKTSRLALKLEEPGDTLVWRSARVLRRDGKSYGYARLWGMSAETALAVVDMLLDRGEPARARPNLSGWEGIDGFLLDLRANAGGYDPGILSTLLRGRWSAGDYVLKSREGRSPAPPESRPLPVALLVNSGTASAGEALALSFRRHKIGPIVGEKTAGMGSGGADAKRLSDGSLLWLSSRAMEDSDGRSYEGSGIPPDIEAADRPPARPGEEEAIVEAAIRALAGGGKR